MSMEKELTWVNFLHFLSLLNFTCGLQEFKHPQNSIPYVKEEFDILEFILFCFNAFTIFGSKVINVPLFFLDCIAQLIEDQHVLFKLVFLAINQIEKLIRLMCSNLKSVQLVIFQPQLVLLIEDGKVLDLLYFNPSQLNMELGIFGI